MSKRLALLDPAMVVPPSGSGNDAWMVYASRVNEFSEVGFPGMIGLPTFNHMSTATYADDSYVGCPQPIRHSLQKMLPRSLGRLRKTGGNNVDSIRELTPTPSSLPLACTLLRQDIASALEPTDQTPPIVATPVAAWPTGTDAIHLQPAIGKISCLPICGVPSNESIGRSVRPMILATCRPSSFPEFTTQLFDEETLTTETFRIADSARSFSASSFDYKRMWDELVKLEFACSEWFSNNSSGQDLKMFLKSRGIHFAPSDRSLPRSLMKSYSFDGEILSLTHDDCPHIKISDATETAGRIYFQLSAAHEHFVVLRIGAKRGERFT